jgi:hypothetical protein
MTAKEFVKSKMPKARSECHKKNGPFGKKYYLIRDGYSCMYFSDGDTESKAWTNAKRKIIEIDNEKNVQI